MSNVNVSVRCKSVERGLLLCSSFGINRYTSRAISGDGNKFPGNCKNIGFDGQSALYYVYLYPLFKK